MARTYRRRRLQPTNLKTAALQPFFSVDLSDRDQLGPFRTGRPPTVVCTMENEPRVLLGTQALAQARRQQAETVPAWAVSCDDVEAGLIAAADRRDSPLLQTAAAVTLLRSKGLPSVAIAAALGVRAWDISRLAAAAAAGERLSTALAKGLLPPAHTRLLARLPPAEQTTWTERAIAGAWSYRALERALREAASPEKAQTPDLGAFAARLGDVLGTEVRLDWPDEPAKRRMTLAWYGPEDLKGLLAKLAEGPETSVSAPIRRELVLQLTTTDELEALTGHLLTE